MLRLSLVNVVGVCFVLFEGLALFVIVLHVGCGCLRFACLLIGPCCALLYVVVCSSFPFVV